MRTVPLGLLALALCASAPAQPAPENPGFLQEYAETRGYLLGRPVKPKVTAQGRIFFLRSSATERSQSLYEWQDGQAVLRADPAQLLAGAQESLSPEEKARNERKRQLGTGFTEYFPSPDGRRLLLPLAGRLHLFDLDRNSLRSLAPQKVIDPQWSPDSRKIAYVKDYDLYVLDLASGRERRLTRGGTRQLSHGVAEFVAQEEMRRLSGFCWSPDSRRLAFQEADHRPVEIWYISDPLHPENAPQQQYYPRPGQANVKSRLGIVALSGGPIRWIDLPREAEYLASLRWSRTGPLVLQLQDRLQHKLQLVQVDPERGGLRLLVEEKHPCWVPLHQEVPIFLPDGRFLYLVEHADRLKLSLHDADGKRLRLLDEGQDYDLTEVVEYDRHRDAVLCRVDRQPGNPELLWLPLNPGALVPPIRLEGVQEAVIAPTGVVVSQQSMQQYPRLVWCRDSGELQELEGKGLSPRLHIQASFQTVSAGGRDYRTILLKPRDFQPGHRYPVILDVYGGPTKIQVAHNARAWLMDQWLADQGFLVVAADNRGTPGRGRDWETSVYGRFDEVPLQDQIEAIQALGALHPELDLERVGVWGWSFGGYLAAQAVLKRPDFFKAAIAGAPVTDWSDYDTHYTERYLGTPQSQPEAYRKSNLVAQAGSLRRPLLLVHGSADDNVYYRHSLKLSEALFRAGQPHELLTLPGITHSFRADVEVTRELWGRTVRFFQQHLGPSRQAP